MSHVSTPSAPQRAGATRTWLWAGLTALTAAFAPSAQAADAVCFYEHTNYQGASFCADSDNNWVGGAWNDRVSSVKVKGGYQVELFEHSNYGGRSLKLSGDNANLVNSNFNDFASSFKVTTTGCNAVNWTEGTVYHNVGTVVKYVPNGNYYKLVNVTAGGSDATNPTISTWYWQPTSCGGGGGNNGGGGLPARIVGGYYPDWKPSPLRIRDLPANYNVVYLFAARPVGGAPGTTGAVTWTPPGNGRGAAANLKADIAYARQSQGRRIILSVGGAGNGMSFPNRNKSQTFVDSVVSIVNNQLGGIDGMDWNTFEGSQAPDTNEMIWISKELKRRIPGFIISAPPAPWNSVDKAFCKAMVDAGAMDYAAPQYYDGPNLANPDYVVNNVKEWVSLLGASHVAVGFGINTALPNYMNRDQAINTWNRIEANHPSIRGGFDWEIGTDETQGWPFANGVGPLIK